MRVDGSELRAHDHGVHVPRMRVGVSQLDEVAGQLCVAMRGRRAAHYRFAGPRASSAGGCRACSTRSRSMSSRRRARSSPNRRPVNVAVRISAASARPIPSPPLRGSSSSQPIEQPQRWRDP